MDIGDVISIMILVVAVTNGYAAWLSDKSFNAIRRTDVGDRFVWAFCIMATSWAFFSLAAQQFFPEPSNIRNVLVVIGLATKLIGVLVLISGLLKLRDVVGEFR